MHPCVHSRTWYMLPFICIFLNFFPQCSVLENGMEFPQKIKRWNFILFQWSHCWDYTVRILKYQFKRTCTPMFITALFTIAKYWKQPKCPSVNEWIKKPWYIYAMEYYTAERNKEFLPFTTAWMDLESIMLSEISQVVKDKYHMISLMSGT